MYLFAIPYLLHSKHCSKETGTKPWQDQLRLRALGNSSLSSATAAINSFLKLSDRQTALNSEIAEWHGESLVDGEAPRDLFARLSTEMRTRAEVKNLMRNSMLASVVRLNPDGVEKPGNHLVFSKKDQIEDKEFSAEYIMPLLDAATSWRDKAFWALVAGAGLRMSEAAQITWDAVLTEQRKVFIYDPEGHRYADQLPEEYAPRFKGRKYSGTYIIPQLRDVFFEALEQYVRREYRPTGNHNLVFQDIRTGQNGRPFMLVSDKNMGSAFKRACRRAGVPRLPNGEEYTLHSLRHFYGVFMLNYIPVEGGYGLKLTEVQRLMGHEKASTTAKYAREDKLILQSKLELFDQFVLNGGLKETDLRTMLAKRHQEAAKRLLSGITGETGH
ncbi:tyrosine-type recombinase/integrase [Sulfitobacter brevis]|nr:site-specific integrase [Sulfitobacter brevis]